MSSHGNNLFGFTKDQTRGSFVSMAAETEAPKDNNMTIGDPISQNFS